MQLGAHKLAYLDAGSGARTILMVHGNPVSAYVYRGLMEQLAPHFRCVAPDLLGFGLSDKPGDEDAYSLAGHIDLMAAFVEQLDLREVVIVGHDWGGPIGFGAALRAQARYTHLVVLNTLTEAPMKIMPVYKLPFYFMLWARRLFDYLVKQRNLFQKMGVGIMRPEDQAVYFRANHSPQTRAAIAAFPRMIPYKQAHPNYALLKQILDGLKAWSIPALVLFSDHDSVFSSAQGERFAVQMQQAQYKLIAGPKHFLQYERPFQIAAEIIEFLSTTYE